MEENSDINNEINKESADNTTKSKSEEIKGLGTEGGINLDTNNANSQSNYANKVDIRRLILLSNP